MKRMFDDSAPEADFSIALPARPYPGLRAFDEAEWPIFFGRERMVDAVVSQLLAQPLLLVHGDSGSGKSSLIRAGVLPRLRLEQARAGLRWRTVTAMPRGGPLRNLARALAALDGRADDGDRVLALRRALNQGRHAPQALAELLLAGAHDHLCILIDQFEELFEHARLHGPGEARLLSDALVAMAVAPPRGLYLVLTMRSEYLGACARFPGLAEAVNAHQYLLPPMAVADLLRAIREPAQLYAGEVEAGLAERLAADAAGIDGLPLVQHALMLMQREHAPLPDDLDSIKPWRLTMMHYPEGGLAAQLSRHADGVAQQAQAVAPQAERLVEDLFRALTSVNAEGHAVRRPQPLAALAATLQVELPVLARVIDAFRAEGVTFLAPRDARPLLADDWIDICHEALIRGWQALADPQRGWLISEFRNGLVWRALLVQAESFERDANNVLSPATTEERLRWLKRRNPAWAERYGGGWDRVQALIAASEARRSEAEALHARSERLARAGEAAARAGQQRLRYGLFAALVLALIALYQWRDASTARDANDRLQAANHARADDLASVLTNLRLKARTAATLPKLQQDVFDAVRQVDGLAEELVAAPQQTVTANKQSVAEPGPAQTGAAAATGRPVVYLQYADPAQKDAVQRLQRALQRQSVGNDPINVPGIEAVKFSISRNVLRCFRAAECRDDAPRVLEAINALLDSPKLRLDDASAPFQQARGLRPRQYELWFAAGEIRLAAEPPAAAASR